MLDSLPEKPYSGYSLMGVGHEAVYFHGKKGNICCFYLLFSGKLVI